MTASEARMVAKELYKLLRADLITEVVNSQPDEWLTIPQVAKVLQCSESTLRKNIQDIPHTKTIGGIRVSRRELERYIARR